MSIKDNLYYYKAKISRVVDGDTVKFEYIDLGFNLKYMNQTGRLIGIDTYELKDKVPEKKALAYKGKEYMVKRVEGKEVIIKSREFKIMDNFARLLVEIYDGDELINDTLVRLGLAEIYLD